MFQHHFISWEISVCIKIDMSRMRFLNICIINLSVMITLPCDKIIEKYLLGNDSWILQQYQNNITEGTLYCTGSGGVKVGVKINTKYGKSYYKICCRLQEK